MPSGCKNSGQKFICQTCGQEGVVYPYYIKKFGSVPKTHRQCIRNTIEERFWCKVNKSGLVVTEDLGNCWIWTGSVKGRVPYGAIRVGKKMELAHRIGYSIQNGQIPDGLNVCHKCDNTLCVRGEHLYVGTDKENMADKYLRNRANHKSIQPKLENLAA